ncbi:MAG: diacylglycerol kinase family lipid kinase [Erysipelotrichales bacterium]|nr:MAG: diacylglycerol kinase family lipid kinase [Erysipelotrichales bacterium]
MKTMGYMTVSRNLAFFSPNPRSDPMKHIFIVNPVSGKGKAKKLIPLIESYFANHPGEFEIIETLDHGSATEIAGRYHKEDDVVIYSVGGDGTAFEVLNGLNDQVPMAVIPGGTGNDFFRMTGYKIKDFQKIIADTIEGKNVRVDHGMCNGKKIINTSSMGFDAQINNTAERIGKNLPIPRTMVYLVSVFITLSQLRAYDLTLELVDGIHKFRAVLIVINNGRWYGGGFQPTPMADIQDGQFDICVIDECNWLTVLRMLPKYMKGTHINEPIAHFFKADQFTLKSEGNVDIAFDGEALVGDRFDYHIIKGGLYMRVPQSSTLDSKYPD